MPSRRPAQQNDGAQNQVRPDNIILSISTRTKKKEYNNIRSRFLKQRPRLHGPESYAALKEFVVENHPDLAKFHYDPYAPKPRSESNPATPGPSTEPLSSQNLQAAIAKREELQCLLSENEKFRTRAIQLYEEGRKVQVEIEKMAEKNSKARAQAEKDYQVTLQLDKTREGQLELAADRQVALTQKGRQQREQEKVINNLTEKNNQQEELENLRRAQLDDLDRENTKREQELKRRKESLDSAIENLEKVEEKFQLKRDRMVNGIIDQEKEWDAKIGASALRENEAKRKEEELMNLLSRLQSDEKDLETRKRTLNNMERKLQLQDEDLVKKEMEIDARREKILKGQRELLNLETLLRTLIVRVEKEARRKAYLLLEDTLERAEDLLECNKHQEFEKVIKEAVSLNVGHIEIYKLIKAYGTKIKNYKEKLLLLELLGSCKGTPEFDTILNDVKENLKYLWKRLFQGDVNRALLYLDLKDAEQDEALAKSRKLPLLSHADKHLAIEEVADDFTKVVNKCREVIRDNWIIL